MYIHRIRIIRMKSKLENCSSPSTFRRSDLELILGGANESFTTATFIDFDQNLVT